ncbi:MAG: ABC transporter, permease protein 1 (cluster 5, nickel/peptides/opines), partial [uncultured Acetobacteraceae bacterium]
VRLHRAAHPGDDPGHGDRRAVRVLAALHRAGRPGRGDRRRPSDARRRGAHPPEPRARPALPGAVRRVGVPHPPRRPGRVHLHQPARFHDDRTAGAADPLPHGPHPHPRGHDRGADGRGGGVAAGHADRPRGDGLRGARLLGAGVRGGLPARLRLRAGTRLAPGAGLHLHRPGPLALAGEPYPAGGRAGWRVHRADRPHHPRDHAGSAATGLHPHRARQGRGAGQRPVPPRAEERGGAHRHRHRHRRRAADRRRGGDGERVRHPRPRPPHRGRHPAARLPGDPGRDPFVLLRLRAGEPADRHPLHPHRPEDTVL